MHSKDPERTLGGADASADHNSQFPTARYFQIHFEYLHSQLAELKLQMELTNRQISALTQQQLAPGGTQRADATLKAIPRRPSAGKRERPS